jgi:preprotein translocase subunit SecG
MLVFLYALVVIISILLIGIILIQPSKSGGMGAAFGGVGESVFGAQAGSHLTKATVVMTAIFLALSLLLAALIGHGVGSKEAKGVDALVEASAKTTAPAAQK